MTGQIVATDYLLDSPRVSAVSLDFTLPKALEAHEPPEARGLARDAVRLLVSRRTDDSIQHTTFRNIAQFLQEGDVLVINTSATLPAALPAQRDDGTLLMVHLSTRLPGDLWTVELRQQAGNGQAKRSRFLMPV
jgi:S-adenosylmethionine:tRNA ribosyltransferase-isomerase